MMHAHTFFLYPYMVNACARFLEAAFWSLEHDGQRVSDFIEESIVWREKIGADRLRKEDVLDQGKNGAIIVKGHDRSRCQNKKGGIDHANHVFRVNDDYTQLLNTPYYCISMCVCVCLCVHGFASGYCCSAGR